MDDVAEAVLLAACSPGYIDEESDPEKIKEVRSRFAPPISEEDSKYLVHFHVEGVRPLVGRD